MITGNTKVSELYHSEDELMHYGVPGMKWGVRKDKALRRINTMYDRSNKWTERKIKKLHVKGKTAKENVMKFMLNSNKKRQKEINKAYANIKTKEEWKKIRKRDFADTLLGGQKWMDRNFSMMSNPLSRLGEYTSQRGMRWASNFTMNSTLARMNVSQGYEYLNRKQLASKSYNSGYNSGVNR